MDNRWLKGKKALIKEVGKQSRKFIDIYDKGYNDSKALGQMIDNALSKRKS